MHPAPRQYMPSTHLVVHEQLGVVPLLLAFLLEVCGQARQRHIVAAAGRQRGEVGMKTKTVHSREQASQLQRTLARSATACTHPSNCPTPLGRTQSANRSHRHFTALAGT
jgi:hypothetical protein